MQFKSEFRIGSKAISANSPTFVIAEVGSNHDCSLEEAFRYVHAAKEAGVDAVKFQSFTAEGLFSRKRPIQGKPELGWEAHPAYPVIDKLTLPEAWHEKLKAECDRIGIEFMSAPFDLGRAKLLKRIGCRAIKIASGELNNFQILSEVGSYGVPIILSTGMGTIGEVEQALEVLWKAGCREVALLHCVSSYPPRFEEMNLRAISTMAQAFSVPVGISDHTPGLTVPLVSLGLGSRCVEKHVTFDRKKSGPDHPYALEWPEFTALVRELRNGEAALGSGKKIPTVSEQPERVYARKGLYAAKELRKGDVITTENTKVVRHGFGIQVPDLERAFGKKIGKNIGADEAIFWEDIVL